MKINKKSLKLLKHKKGGIIIKVFLKMKKMKINKKSLKLLKHKKGNNYKSIFENEKNKNQ
jgi:hypothetical protein